MGKRDFYKSNILHNGCNQSFGNLLKMLLCNTEPNSDYQIWKFSIKTKWRKSSNTYCIVTFTSMAKLQTPSTFVSRIQQKNDFPSFSNIVNTINTLYWEGNFEAGHIKVVGWWFFDWFGFSGVAVCCCFLINYINLWYISQFLFHLILSVTK